MKSQLVPGVTGGFPFAEGGGGKRQAFPGLVVQRVVFQGFQAVVEYGFPLQPALVKPAQVGEGRRPIRCQPGEPFAKFHCVVHVTPVVVFDYFSVKLLGFEGLIVPLIHLVKVLTKDTVHLSEAQSQQLFHDFQRT
jgi:hypothetical protein